MMGLPRAPKSAGLGEEPYPGFPYDQAPDQMPDLQKHNSIMSDVLKEDPSASLPTTPRLEARVEDVLHNGANISDEFLESH